VAEKEEKMKPNQFWIVMFSFVLISILSGGGVACAHEDQFLKGSIVAKNWMSYEQLVKLAKISFRDALDVALKKVPGHVFKAELGAENAFLVYSFEIVGLDNMIYDVAVDGGNGKILDLNKE
jgi:uncharacterized membrane protein YkoI